MSSDAPRALQVSCSALPDDTLIHYFRGRERLGRPFKFKILLSSSRADLSPDEVLDAPITVTLNGRKGYRAFNGIVARFSFVDVGDLNQRAVPRTTWYRAVIRPALWRLTRSSHTRLFCNMNVLDIAEQLLGEHGITPGIKCTQDYPKWDSCTQYRETDFDFFNRLLQREGIYYYFEHPVQGGGDDPGIVVRDGGSGGAGRAQTDKIVLVDDTQKRVSIRGYEEIPFGPVLDGQDGMPAGESVYRWKSHRRVVPGKSETNSFDYLNADRSRNQGLLARATDAEVGNSAYVIEEPALRYVDESVGRRYAESRLDSHLRRAAPVVGKSSSAGMWPGARFKLTGHPYKKQVGDYFITDVKYRITAGGVAPSAGKSRKSKKRSNNGFFDCTFRAIPNECRYRGAYWAKVPDVGPQTAIVIASEGDDFATDKYGQVKVQFHWEQFNPPGASKRMQRCWARVAQPWAGKGWGAMFLPREGQEVLVDFLNGDPDCPVVVGGLYNSSNKPPYTLPAAGAVSTIRTEGVGAKDGERNELRFNDHDLQVLLYTDGRYDNYVKADSFTWIGKDSHTIVQERQLIKAGSQHVTVQGSQNTKALDVSLKADTEVVHEAGAKYVVKSEIVHIKSGATVVLEAPGMITLKSGSSYVVVDPDGVHISGPMVYLNSAGASGSGPGGTAKSPDQPERADDGSSVK